MRNVILQALVACLASASATYAEELNAKDKFPSEVQKVEDFLHDLGQGNDHSGTVDKATFNTATGELTVEVSVRSGHTWKAFGKRVVAYDWTVSGRGTYNVRTGKGDAELDLGRGVKVDVKEVAKLLASVK